MMRMPSAEFRLVRTRWYHKLWDRLFPAKPDEGRVRLGKVTFTFWLTVNSKGQYETLEIPTIDVDQTTVAQ